MRHQDELLGLYPTASATTRRYLLYQLPGLPLHFDSDELDALLDRARTDRELGVHDLSLWAWDRAGAELTLLAVADGDALALKGVRGGEPGFKAVTVAPASGPDLVGRIEAALKGLMKEFVPAGE